MSFSSDIYVIPPIPNTEWMRNELKNCGVFGSRLFLITLAGCAQTADASNIAISSFTCDPATSANIIPTSNPVSPTQRTFEFSCIITGGNLDKLQDPSITFYDGDGSDDGAPDLAVTGTEVIEQNSDKIVLNLQAVTSPVNPANNTTYFGVINGDNSSTASFDARTTHEPTLALEPKSNEENPFSAWKPEFDTSGTIITSDIQPEFTTDGSATYMSTLSNGEYHIYKYLSSEDERTWEKIHSLEAPDKVESLDMVMHSGHIFYTTIKDGSYITYGLNMRRNKVTFFVIDESDQSIDINQPSLVSHQGKLYQVTSTKNGILAVRTLEDRAWSEWKMNTSEFTTAYRINVASDGTNMVGVAIGLDGKAYISTLNPSDLRWNGWEKDEYLGMDIYEDMKYGIGITATEKDRVFILSHNAPNVDEDNGENSPAQNIATSILVINEDGSLDQRSHWRQDGTKQVRNLIQEGSPLRADIPRSSYPVTTLSYIGGGIFQAMSYRTPAEGFVSAVFFRDGGLDSLFQVYGIEDYE